GIDQINRLQSNNAKLEIAPGNEAGESVVLIRNQRSAPVHLFATYDNQGAKSTGEHQGAATVTLDGVLGFNESLMASHRESLPLDERAHSSNSDAFSVSIPFGYNLYSIDLNRSKYDNVLTLQSGANAVAQGDNSINSFSWNRVVYRDQSSRLSFGAGLTNKDSRNYFADQYLDVSSRKLSVLDLRSGYSTSVRDIFLQMDLDYARGLTEFGAMHDTPALPADQPHAQFQKVTARLYARVPFSIAGQAFSYDSELNMQQAWNPLYGSEQILIGGIYSVRGFFNNSLSGDKGYYWRNEVALPKAFPVGAQTFSGKLYAGVDIGRVWNLADLPGGRLSGATVGLQARWRSLILDLSHSSTISLPSGLAREAAQTWFRISAAL
ncbi:MAG: ShlB/FhaC/HecB family hemolysin secretion/activation protein, partial [Janthinobacterium lividum]